MEGGIRACPRSVNRHSAPPGCRLQDNLPACPTGKPAWPATTDRLAGRSARPTGSVSYHRADSGLAAAAPSLRLGRRYEGRAAGRAGGEGKRIWRSCAGAVWPLHDLFVHN